MSLNDALIITSLGLGVVFSGLILTAMLISSLSVIPALLKKGPKKINSNLREEPQTAAAVEAEPEIIAVITAVLETEIRIHRAYGSSQFTFRRFSAQSLGWTANDPGSNLPQARG